jgi:hypothetical protein
VEPLTTAATHVAGFVGMSARGPLDEPRRITSWDEFCEVYHSSPDGFLAQAVEGFFANGGRACYVVRIAHRAADGQAAGPEHISFADRVVKDAWDKQTVRIRALNEGRWGNNIWVRTEQTTGARSLLTMDIEVGSGVARVSSTRGFERGALVRLYDRESSSYIVVTGVGERQLEWGPLTPMTRRFRAAGPTYLEVVEFEIYATLRDRREAFRGLQLSPLSRKYVERVVNEQSQLIRVDDLKSSAPFPHNLPRPDPPSKLSGGRDGTESLISEDILGRDLGPGDRRGLLALGGVDEVGMLAVPDAMVLYQRAPGPAGEHEVQRIQDTMVQMCENLKDRFAILDAPPVKDVEVVRRWRRRIDSSYASMYFPWIGIGEEGARMKVLPPSGHIAGIYARCESEQGVHKAPANEVLHGAVGLALELTDDHQGSLNAEGINPLRSCGQRGVRVWGARTMSSDQDWRYLNVRRLFIMLRRSLEQGTQWAVFEPNYHKTWEIVGRSATTFLKALWERGFFVGGDPAQAFYVKCDEETNSGDVVDQGRLVVEIGVAPTIPAEYIVFHVVQEIAVAEAQAEGGQT